LVQAVHAGYYGAGAGSDSVLRAFRRVAGIPAAPREMHLGALNGLGYVLAGLGRVREARIVADSLAAIAPDRAAGLLGWSTALGLIPRSSRIPLLDSVAGALPAEAEGTYVRAVGAIVQGQPAEARRQLDRALANRDSAALRPQMRGLFLATSGWASLAEGDSAAGLARLREGLDLAAAPGAEEETSFLRFQLALALAGRETTRREGIRRLRDGLDLQGLFIPLSFLALGRAWEAAGDVDSAAFAYGRFVRLWDKADPELQGRVAEAREALRRLTAEPGAP
jgi:tetratricopeptide (TPR) repeat protein